MSYIRWDPWKRINQMIAGSELDTHAGDEIARCQWKPAVDIFHTAEGVFIKADLPGVKKENVSVELKDNLMTLKGERTAAISVESNRCYRQERCFGTFFRAFTLPERINPEHIQAVLKNGVLEIHLPRPAEDKPRMVPVS
jgi:HSP20 family protein